MKNPAIFFVQIAFFLVQIACFFVQITFFVRIESADIQTNLTTILLSNFQSVLICLQILEMQACFNCKVPFCLVVQW